MFDVFYKIITITFTQIISMELILDQLELGTEHSLVLTEKLFEHYTHREIQDFSKQIQAKLVKKNKQLKEVFSTKYQDLLDCSELVNGITKYTSQIVKVNCNILSEQISTDCTDVLHTLLYSSPAQTQDRTNLYLITSY